MNITKKIIKYNYSPNNTVKYIVIHDTGNTDLGANANQHYKYFNGGDRQSSAHYFVDEGEIVQCVEDFNQSWHNGRKYISNPNVPQCNNSNSIGIEICINRDGNLSKAIINTIELTKMLMKKYNIPIQNIIRHYDSCGKMCPLIMVGKNETEWKKFKLHLQEPKSENVKSQLKTIALKINLFGKEKAVLAINIDGNNYVKLRDLECEKIKIGFIKGVVIINDKPFKAGFISHENQNYVKLRELEKIGLKIDFKEVPIVK